MVFQTVSGQEVSGLGSDSGFELLPKVFRVPGLPSVVPRPPAPRPQPLALVRFEKSGRLIDSHEQRDHGLPSRTGSRYIAL